MGFEEAQRNVRETLPSHFLREVIKGVLSWSCCLRKGVTASLSMAARLSKSSPVELTVIKVALADGTVVFHLMCQEKCFCQMSVTEPTSIAWCQRDIKKMSMLHHSLNFTTGRGYGRYPSDGPRLMISVLVSQDFIVDYGYLLKSREPRQQRLNSASPPSRLFSLARCCAEDFGVAIHLPPCSQFSDVL